MKYDIYVYMLRCADGSYYVGSYRGADLDWRVGEHNAGKHPTAYTFSRRPVQLVWSGYFTNATDAIAFERRLKGWSRAKKEALIRGDEAALKACAQRGFRPAAILRDGVSPAGETPPQDEAFPCCNNTPPHPEEGAKAPVTKDAQPVKNQA